MNEGQKEVAKKLDGVIGVGADSAKAIISVIGTDMSRFPTDAHISSWGGFCPGNHESAKKRAVREDTQEKPAVAFSAGGMCSFRNQEQEVLLLFAVPENLCPSRKETRHRGGCPFHAGRNLPHPKRRNDISRLGSRVFQSVQP